MSGRLAAVGRTQGAAVWAVGRGQAGANWRVRPDWLALGAGSWPRHWGMFSRWSRGIKLLPATGAEANLGSAVADQAVLTVHRVLSQRSQGPCEPPRGVLCKWPGGLSMAGNYWAPLPDHKELLGAVDLFPPPSCFYTHDQRVHLLSPDSCYQVKCPCPLVTGSPF